MAESPETRCGDSQGDVLILEDWPAQSRHWLFKPANPSIYLHI